MDLLAELLNDSDVVAISSVLWDELARRDRSDRLRQFTFNVFDVDLDFGTDTAVIHDVLAAHRSSAYSLEELRARLPRHSVWTEHQ